MRRPIPSWASDLAVALTILLAAASGLAVGHWLRTLHLCCGDPAPISGLELLASAYAELAAALLVVVPGTLVVATFGRSRWLWLVVAASAGTLLALARAHRQRAEAVGFADAVRPDGTAVMFVLALPTTWPLLGAAVLALSALVARAWAGRVGP